MWRSLQSRFIAHHIVRPLSFVFHLQWSGSIFLFSFFRVRSKFLFIEPFSFSIFRSPAFMSTSYQTMLRPFHTSTFKEELFPILFPLAQEIWNWCFQRNILLFCLPYPRSGLFGGRFSFQRHASTCRVADSSLSLSQDFSGQSSSRDRSFRVLSNLLSSQVFVLEYRIRMLGK